MDPVLAARELSILKVLMSRMGECKEAVFSSFLVSSMKEEFSELTTERIHALFMCMSWMFQRCIDSTVATPEVRLNSSVAPDDVVRNVPSTGVKPESNAAIGFDPLLGQVVNPLTPDLASSLLDAASVLNSVVSKLDSPSHGAKSDADFMDMTEEAEVMFPDLFQVKDIDFDFGD